MTSSRDGHSKLSPTPVSIDIEDSDISTAKVSRRRVMNYAVASLMAVGVATLGSTRAAARDGFTSHGDRPDRTDQGRHDFPDVKGDASRDTHNDRYD